MILAILLLVGCAPKAPQSASMSKETLMDKIRGGWAGQTIGVVYGAPTEFKFTGTLIPDGQPISWGDGYVKYWWDRKPGLFDDVYNDLTFAEALVERLKDLSVTNMTTKRLAEELKEVYGYQTLAVDHPEGEYCIGNDGFVEFHMREGAAVEWVLEHMYTEIQ